MNKINRRVVPAVPAVPAVSVTSGKKIQPADGLPLKAALYSSFLCILFGGNNVAIKFCMEGIGPFSNGAYRFLLASIALILWGKLTHQSMKITWEQFWILLPMPIIFFVQLSFFYVGQSLTLASHGALLTNLMPLVVMFLAHFFIQGDRITLRKSIGLLLGFVSASLLFLDKTANMAGASAHGDILILVAILCWAANTIYVKRVIHHFNILAVTLYPMMLTTPFFFLAAYLFDEPMKDPFSFSVLGGLFFQSFITASYGFIAWNKLLNQYGATSLNSFVFLIPVSGVFFGVLLLGDPLTINIFLSIIFVVVSLIIVNKKPGKRKKESSLTQ